VSPKVNQLLDDSKAEEFYWESQSRVLESVAGGLETWQVLNICVQIFEFVCKHLNLCANKKSITIFACGVRSFPSAPSAAELSRSLAFLIRQCRKEKGRFV
jgi:hypothetical protein